MAPHIKLTLQQVAQTALGTQQLTHVNIKILHGLIDVLLKKLNCHNEKIVLRGIEAKSLQKLLNTAKSTPMTFNNEQLENVANKVDNLQCMEQRIAELEAKLDQHLTILAQASNLEETTLRYESWPTEFAQLSNSIVSTCESKHEIACFILQNTDLMQKLLRRLDSPMIDHMFELENKIENFRNDLLECIDRAKVEFEKIALLYGCLEQVISLGAKVENNYAIFIGTMEEMQDMLDAKLNKMHIPALKKYIKDNISHIEAAIKHLQSREDCPKPKGVVTSNIKCVSCGETKVCIDVGVHGPGILPGAVLKSPPKIPKICVCNRLYLESKGTGVKKHVQQLNYTRKPTNRSQKDACDGHFELLTGFDGNLYRKG